MFKYRLVALAALWLWTTASAQYIRRRGEPFPVLERRFVTNCTDCEFCAQAVRADWQLASKSVTTYAVATIVETVYPDGSTSTATVSASLDGDAAEQLSRSLSLYSGQSDLHTTMIDDRDGVVTVTYPTPYIIFQDDYVWNGNLTLDGICAEIPSDDFTAESGPANTPAVAAPPFSAVLPGLTDTLGWYFELIPTYFDDQLGPYVTDPALKSCAANCKQPAFAAFVQDSVTAFPTAGGLNLDAAFVTICKRTFVGGGGEDCTEVSFASTAPGGGGGGGDRYTTVKDSTTYITTDSGGGGGGGGGVTTTVTQPGGATVVVQGGSLASPGAVGVTVTDEQGSLIVVQGGVTGTLTTAPGGGTVVVVGTATQTSWVPGASISGAGGGMEAEPTALGAGCVRRVPLELGGAEVLLLMVGGAVGLV